MWTGPLLVKDLGQYFDGISVLENVQKRGAHREMLDGFEYMYQTFRLQQLACA